jgi:hypothetical protein
MAATIALVLFAGVFAATATIPEMRAGVLGFLGIGYTSPNIPTPTGPTDDPTISDDPTVTPTDSQPPKVNIDWNALEVVSFSASHMGWRNLPTIMGNVELIIEGEVIDEMVERVITGWDKDIYGYTMPTSGYSYAKVRITKVFQGDKQVGDVITLGLAYFIAEAGESGRDIDYPRLITTSEMTPVRNGERWFFFLDTFEAYMTEEAKEARKGQEPVYWPQGDFLGRFPIPDAEMSSFIEKYNGLLASEKAYFDAIDPPPILSDADVKEYQERLDAGEITGQLISHADKEGTWHNYYVTEEQYDTLMAYWVERDDLHYSLDPAKCGVYEPGRFDINLYADICDEFYR